MCKVNVPPQEAAEDRVGGVGPRSVLVPSS